MKNLKVYQVNAFTKIPFEGNPAGVVLNADGLSSEDMFKIAKELGNPETAFLFKGDEHCDAKIRFFCPTKEVPLCGHASIAAMYVKAIEENLNSECLNIETNVGILPFDIIKTNEDYEIIMTQGKFSLKEKIEEEYINDILAALDLKHEDLDVRCPIQEASTGNSKIMIGIKSKNILNSLKPNLHALSLLSKKIGCNGYFVFTLDSDNKDVLVNARMFSPNSGINEDPVTGTANGPLGAYLRINNIVKTNNKIHRFTSVQGEAMGRPGKIEVISHFENNIPVKIQIKGTANIIFKTEIKY
ncbi:MAG: PhzF family phenazine biosynthesis isomerase [Marinifilaceae bacterium]|jgi:PhzF family phenazine biosynthesis protein|nr:PhzF family phenazine biosynthesis isomerase [Marinifilaceae bacterium]